MLASRSPTSPSREERIRRLTMCERLILVCGLLLVAGCELNGDKPAEANTAAHLPAGFQCGVDYAHIHRRGHGYGSAVSAAELARLKDVGVTWVALTPFAYQSSATADQIVGFPGHDGPGGSFQRRDPSLTDQDLIAEVAAAHQLGIRVTLKPHIWSRDFWEGREWQGSIRQDSAAAHAQWWACFREFSLHYARLAETARIDQYCLGTELLEMTTRYPDEWRALIADVRAVYHGPLTYDAHCERELDRIQFWDALDSIGISAYFPLDVPVGASVEQLTAAWRPHCQLIEKLQARFKRPVIFMEIGYRAVADAHQMPWVYHGGTPDLAAQARAYEAVFRAFAGRSWWQGAYFWKAFTDPELAEARGDGTDYSFRNRPAEAVLRKWYGSDVTVVSGERARQIDRK